MQTFRNMRNKWSDRVLTVTFVISVVENPQGRKISSKFEGQLLGVLRVFNPLPYAIDDVITVRVDSRNVAVYQDNAPVEAQLEPYISNAQIAQNTYQLAFVARLLPLTTVSFVLKQEANPESTTIAKVFTVASQVDKWKGAMLPNPFAVTEIQPDKFRLTGKSLTTKHDPATGLITEISTSNGESHKIANSFVAYKNSRGGAYLMRVADKPDPYITGDVARILVAGPVQQSIHLFTQNIYQTISAKNIRGSLANQLSMTVRIDIAKEYNTEVMMRFDVAMDKRADFSDSVGMQLLRRDHFDKLSVQANYYPMPSAAVMENDQQRITIASNLEHGVRFLDTGVEIGIDRMLAQDDGKGLGSSADSLPTDLKPVQMEFKIVLEKSRAAQTNEHFTAHSSAGHLAVQTVLYPPIVLAGVGPPTEVKRINSFPCEVQLLTIRPLNESTRLLTLFKHPTLCEGGVKPTECGRELTTSLRSFLTSMEASTVQLSDLSGTRPIGSAQPVSSFVPQIKDFEFLNLIVV